MTDSASSTSSSPRVRIEDVVCPFCGLGCDDLTVEIEGEAVTALPPACGNAARLFARGGSTEAAPLVNGAPVELASAVAAAARMLAGSRATLFAGLGADVAGLRALVALAETVGGVLDHDASPGLFRALSTAQRRGWIATTIAEVRNRADVVLVIGADPTPTFGRAFERLVPPRPAYAQGPRRVIFLGGEPGETARAQLAHAEVTVVPVAGSLADALVLLEALLAGRRPVADGAVGALRSLAEILGRARYAAVIFEAAALPEEEGDLVVEAAVALVDTLNLKTRAGILPLGGRDDVIGANQVMLWRIGFPLRTAVRAGGTGHDPAAFATGQAAHDTEVMVWTSAFRPVPPPAFAGRTIALAHWQTPFASPPEVFIPVATPGIDHGGHVFRTDTVVSLPLKALRRSSLPSVADIARAITAQAHGRAR